MKLRAVGHYLFLVLVATVLTQFHRPITNGHVSRKRTGIRDAANLRVIETYGKLPLSFEANRGQTDSEVKFLSRGGGYSLFLTSTEAVLSLKKSGDIQNRDPKGADELPGKSNYFIGNDPSKWRTNVPTYAKVKYEDVYPGIDLVYYGNQRQLEYDFVVAPGADPRAIRLAFPSRDRKGAVTQPRLQNKTGPLAPARGSDRFSA